MVLRREPRRKIKKCINAKIVNIIVENRKIENVEIEEIQSLKRGNENVCILFLIYFITVIQYAWIYVRYCIRAY